MSELELPLITPGRLRSNDPATMSVPKSPVDRRSGPTKFTVNIPESYPPPATAQQTYTLKPKASRWSTLEFRIYAVIFAIVVPLMVWVPIRLSNCKSPFFLNDDHPIEAGSLAIRYDSFTCKLCLLSTPTF
jgi:hypothetical protein